MLSEHYLGNTNDPHPKRRRFSRPLRPNTQHTRDSDAALLFSSLSPDVVVSHILPHVLVIFVSALSTPPLVVSRRSMPALVVELQLSSPEPNLFCFGRFCRDLLRHPWFVFRSIQTRQPELLNHISMDRLKLMSLTLLSETRAQRIKFPSSLPLLESLQLEGWIKRFATPMALPSLKSFVITWDCEMDSTYGVRYSRYRVFDRTDEEPVVDREEFVVHPSNFHNLSSLKISGDPIFVNTMLKAIPDPLLLLRLTLTSRASIDILPRFRNLVSLDLSLHFDDPLPKYVVFPCLRSFFVSQSSTKSIAANEIATWVCPVLQRFVWDFGLGIDVVLRAWAEMIGEHLQFLRMDLDGLPTSLDDVVLDCRALRQLEIVGPVNVTAFLLASQFPVLTTVVIGDIKDEASFFPNCAMPVLERLDLVSLKIDVEFFSSFRAQARSNLRILSLACSLSRGSPSTNLEEFEFCQLVSLRSFTVKPFAVGSTENDLQWTQLFVESQLPLLSRPSLINLTLPIEISVDMPPFQELRQLFLSRLTGITSHRFHQTPVFSKLVVLSFDMAPGLTDDFFQIESRFPLLRSLILSRNHDLCGKNWTMMPQLWTFWLRDCERIDLLALFERETERFPVLARLIIYRTNNQRKVTRGEISAAIPVSCRLDLRGLPIMQKE